MRTYNEMDEGRGAYQVIAGGRSTVVAHYQRPTRVEETAYQSEAELERKLIGQLQRQGFEYAQIHSEDELKANLRTQIQKLNDFTFTDAEWQRFFNAEIAADNKKIEDKAFTIQRDNIKAFQTDDGHSLNIRLIDKEHPHANRTQVINQYAVSTGKRDNRYDVTILVNGLPLVHIELKRRGVALKEAFNQINRYGRDSFWANSGLFEYVQIFVISNGTETKYYSNTTRATHVREQQPGKVERSRTCNSYEFTSYWADGDNKRLDDLDDFAATFFSRHVLLNILTRYCVLTTDNKLLVMRPYQIFATEQLLQKVQTAHNAKTFGKRDAGGFIWHTTGSGKTLTSFKAAQLATRMLPYISKVLFVVDRKDLDYQTMKEYDSFEKGAANSNSSTAVLKRQLEDPQCRIIITTIQKLVSFIRKNPQHKVYDEEVVLIFDECHRSQFGDMHTQIVRRFKKYYIFGFTGTPIFKENQNAAGGTLRTTEDVFGRKLHSYTIVDAIRDRNVLRFRIDYARTMKEKEDVENSKVWDIAREQALADPRRIKLVTAYILEHFDQQTKRGSYYSFNSLLNTKEVAREVAGRRGAKVDEVRARTTLSGFNSILATPSIPVARLYYNEFKAQNEALPEAKRLKVATIFSYSPNEDDPTEAEENNDSTEGLDQSSRDFLESAIQDYNKLFTTNYDTSAEGFPNYYKDVSLRMKNREIDLLIVVNMFLTGFDATTLNTLWVDKNLRYHGLLQAYSRTNRILNSVKAFGNIVCFRNLEEATNKCLALYGDKDAVSISQLRKFEEYLRGYVDEKGEEHTGYLDLVSQIQAQYPLNGEPMPAGEEAEKNFIALFGSILRMRNILSCFDEFQQPGVDPLTERQMQDYTSYYLDLRDKYRREHHEKEDITDDIVFEIELVKQVEVNIDFILSLVAEYKDGHKDDVEVHTRIMKFVESSPDLRDKKELIEEFLNVVAPGDDVVDRWTTYVNECKRKELQDIIREEKLKEDKALAFMENAFRSGVISELGLQFDSILPPINPFDPSANRMGRKMAIFDRLKAFFSKYYGFADGEFK